jgi:hypothetical protein
MEREARKRRGRGVGEEDRQRSKKKMRTTRDIILQRKERGDYNFYLTIYQIFLSLPRGDRGREGSRGGREKKERDKQEEGIGEGYLCE